MRSNRLAAAVVLSLSCVLLIASCARQPVAMQEVRGVSDCVPAIETTDDDDPFGGDPDVGAGIGSEPPASDVGSGSWSAPSEPPVTTSSDGDDEEATVSECYAAGRGGTATREEFCRSSCPQEKKRKCWSLVPVSLVEWMGWCTWNF
jgi:hypothetical protein